MKRTDLYKRIIAPLMAVILLTGCIDEEDDKKGSSDIGMLTISGSLGGGGSQKVGLIAQAITYSAYNVYCLTFSNPSYSATSTLGSSGEFSLAMPKGAPFGCFINDSSSNMPVATLVVEDAGSGFGSETSNSLAFNGNVDLGAVELDLDEGTATVPKSRIEASVVDVSSGINLSDMHNRDHVMSCISTGNALIDLACADFISNDGDTVYFRVMDASDGSGAVNGLGVWRSQADFNACGGIDMTDAEVASIESEDGITFSQVTSGAAFVDNQGLCPTRDGNTPSGMEDPEYYYAAGPLHEGAGSYTLYVEDHDEISPGCDRANLTVVTFSADSGSSLVGNFAIGENYEEQVEGSGACDNHTSMNGTFLVRFTPQ